MARAANHSISKVVSANRLNDGIVLYLGPQGWVEQIGAATAFTGVDDVEAAMNAARADEARNVILDPVAVDITTGPDGVQPLTLREAIRAKGPTIDFLASVAPRPERI